VTLMPDWLQGNEELVAWLTAGSVVFFVGSLVVVGVVIVRLPPDYFQSGKRRKAERKGGLLLRIGKNVLGAVLIVAGVAMLVLPGQGVLALLIGVMLTDFPGKFRVERWLLSRGKVLAGANWLRRKFKAPPLEMGSPENG
jgi:hypothetical protein